MQLLVKALAEIINIAVIAHIDHGKSTLSDELIRRSSSLSKKEKDAIGKQVLDSLNVERERGITVKAQSVSLSFKDKNANDITVNLIDTPGHVDFSYEVRRSLSVCEGAVVLVDATQRVQAQTLAVVRAAKENNLKLIPVLNKIDMEGSNPVYVGAQIKEMLGIEKTPLLVSAKTGYGVDALINEIIDCVPRPKGHSQAALQALVVDSWYDKHIGIILLVRVYNGFLKPKMSIYLVSTQKSYRVSSVGVFTPKKVELEELKCGMIGYVVASIKDIRDCAPGDTIGEFGKPCEKLSGFMNIKPSVFCGVYPTSDDAYPALKKALERLRLNDSALTIQDAKLPMLGSGFRCGFLGLLHLEVVQQRLIDDFNVDIIPTAPGVFYKICTKKGDELFIEHPSSMPDISFIDYIGEPWVEVDVFTESQFIGPVIELCKVKRSMEYNKDYIQELSDGRVIVKYLMPLAEIIYDFHDRLKSITKGYSSFDYRFHDYIKGDIVSLNILVQGAPVEPLAVLIHKSRAEFYGRWLINELKEAVDRQQFDIALQACIGVKVIARETVKAYRKDVTAKCYGGDVTRKKKLLEQQKEGKAKMKKMMMGTVSVDISKIKKILVGKKQS